MIEAGTRVTVADKQLHGNSSVLVDGQVIAAEGNHFKVQLDGEEFPRIFSAEQLKTTEEVYGAEPVNSWDNQVINGLRR